MVIYTKSFKDNISYFVICGMAFFMFRGIFAPGFMSGYDNSFHYYDAYYLTTTLIPQYHWISGWSMQHLAGFPVLVDYYQIGLLLIGFLNKMMFLPLDLSYKIMVLASYIALGAGFYKISSYRFGKIAALIAAICFMLQKDIYYDRILGGIWNNYLAIGILFIFFHILDKNINRMTIRKALTLGLLLAALILTHLYVAIFSFILLFIYLWPYLTDATNKEKSPLKKRLIFVCIPLSACMISSYYLYGFIAARGYFREIPPKDLITGLVWSFKSFFGPLERITGLSTLMINIPVMIRIIFSFFGLYIFLRRENNQDIKRFLTCVLAFIIISLVLFSDILPNIFRLWRSIPLVGTLQTSRFLIYIQTGLYIFAGYGIARFLGLFRKKSYIVTVFLLFILGSAIFHYKYFARDGSRILEQSLQMPNIYKIWKWVNQNIPEGEGRIIYQNTIGNIDDPILTRSDVFALSGIFTKVPQIGVSRSASPFPQEEFMRNDQGDIFSRKLKSVDVRFIKDSMDYFNAGYIVSVEPNLEHKLNTSKFFFKEKNFGPFSIFRLKDFKERWIDFEKDANYKTVELNNQRLTFDIWNRSFDNQAFVKIAYHPFWRGWLNNKPVEIRQDKYSLMKIFLPKVGYYKLHLSFNSFSYPWVGISLLSLIISIVTILRIRC